MADPRSQWRDQHIIVQGRESWITADEAVLTLTQLENAEENFARLGFCMLAVLSWGGHSKDKSPQRFLPLIRALPNPAHSTKLDRKFAAEFVLSESELPISR
jgi:hypothetical protein